MPLCEKHDQWEAWDGTKWVCSECEEENENKVISDKTNVKIVWGGWSCPAGYIRWAYVATIKEVHENYQGLVVDGFKGKDVMSIGKHIFEAPKSGPKADGKELPIEVCKRWIKENNHKLVGFIKLGTN